MTYIPVSYEKIEGANGYLKSTYWYKNGRKIVIVCKSILPLTYCFELKYNNSVS